MPMTNTPDKPPARIWVDTIPHEHHWHEFPVDPHCRGHGPYHHASTVHDPEKVAALVETVKAIAFVCDVMGRQSDPVKIGEELTAALSAFQDGEG